MGIVELRFHGRGGQGAVTAANLLASAAVREGKYAQAFPYFGAERRGAPVEAYARISDEPIEVHSQVREPDVVVVLDKNIVGVVDVTRGLKEGGVVIVNSPVNPGIEKGVVHCIDATSIAVSLDLVVGGWPVVNTTMLGALARVTGLVSLESIEEAIRSQFRGSIGEANVEAARKAYSSVSRC